MGANVTEARCTEQRVDHRVGDHVGVAVSAERGAVGKSHAAEDEGALRVWVERMHVEALANTHCHDGPGRSAGVVILRFVTSPSTTTTRPPSASTSAASSVASAPLRCASRNAGSRNACGVCTVTSRVRSSVAVTTAAGVDLLDRVGDRQARDGAIGAGAHGSDDRIEERPGRERPRRIVDDHDRIIGRLAHQNG